MRRFPDVPIPARLRRSCSSPMAASSPVEPAIAAMVVLAQARRAPRKYAWTSTASRRSNRRSGVLRVTTISGDNRSRRRRCDAGAVDRRCSPSIWRRRSLSPARSWPGLSRIDPAALSPHGHFPVVPARKACTGCITASRRAAQPRASRSPSITTADQTRRSR